MLRDVFRDRSASVLHIHVIAKKVRRFNREKIGGKKKNKLIKISFEVEETDKILSSE